MCQGYIGNNSRVLVEFFVVQAPLQHSRFAQYEVSRNDCNQEQRRCSSLQVVVVSSCRRRNEKYNGNTEFVYGVNSRSDGGRNSIQLLFGLC